MSVCSIDKKRIFFFNTETNPKFLDVRELNYYLPHFPFK